MFVQMNLRIPLAVGDIRDLSEHFFLGFQFGCHIVSLNLNGLNDYGRQEGYALAYHTHLLVIGTGYI